MKKTLVISGASSGIGLAIAETFLENDYEVYNLDIEHSEVAQTIICDLTDHQQVLQAVKDIAQSRTIDVMVSNAGRHLSANIEATSEQQLTDLFALNVKGAFSLTQAVIPQMKQNNAGSIIYIGSDQSSVAKRNSCAYNLTKHALASLAKTTALDYADYNIRSNIVCPGTIDTPLYQKAIKAYCDRSGDAIDSVHQHEALQQPLGRIGHPDEVASMVAYLASDKAAFITGAMFAIDGGYTTG